MSGWAHAERLGPVDCYACWIDSFEAGAPQDRICKTPIPDPASPCGARIQKWGDRPGMPSVCGATTDIVHVHNDIFGSHVESEGCHTYVPTRCTCGHALVPA